MVKNQFKGDYIVDERRIQFDISGEREPNITVEFQSHLPGRWIVYKVATYKQVFIILGLDG